MIAIRHIGKSADDLRFFILSDGRHAGGITLHSIRGTSFSYGIAIAPAMRRKGIAKAGLCLLFDDMKARGYTEVYAEIAADNAASLALHASLGFREIHRSAECIRMTKTL